MKAYVLIENKKVDRVNESIRLRIKYEFENMKADGRLGNGVYAYLDLNNHMGYLIDKADRAESKILELDVDTSDCIDTLTDKGQGRLRGIWNYGGGFKGDSDFLEYLSAKAKGLVGIHIEGDLFHKDIAITSQFIGRLLCIYDTSIIRDFSFI